MDKGKSKMVAPGKLPVKRTRSSTVAEAPAPTLVTKSTPPQSRLLQFQFTKAPKKKLATGAREDCSSRKFHEECYYDFKAFAASPFTKFSTSFCCRYFLEPFMVPRPFFYPRIIREFYRTMTSRGVYPPSAIYFEIDGRQGMLNFEMVARAFDIPFTPPNPAEFQPITQIEVAEMESFTVSKWQGSVTKTESTLTSASLTTDNEHHYVPPPNLILEDFGDGEDTPPRPLAATTLGATFTPQIRIQLHIFWLVFPLPQT
ncbi:hypothetical protein CK203_031955 [Vitis vinifera]|uniref:Uncharacterized protein n=1 Tax=Vitis vinifera TaxID=29760 RepID=A0A438IN90_VITVI|nr:hypothetical protein CK203_031955 [Vitis vinifera]